MDKITNLKFSFVHLDFDLYQSTMDTFNFIKDRLEKNAIILFDDYNLINQEGVKKAVSYYHNFGIKETFTHLHSVEE